MSMAVLAFAAAGLASAAAAQTVAMTGSMGSRALLVIDGKAVTATAGTTVQGVRVISVQSDRAVVEVGGQRQTVVLGAAQVRLGGGSAPAGGTTIELVAGSGGHFQTQGSINGGAVTFMVDTGATTVSMSTADAERLGVKYQQGLPVGLQTANGVVRGWRVTLDRVRVGDVEVYNVEGVVAQRDMPFVLLGNSFLDRFQMKRVNDRMTLERRY
jgi:aspartyl protease family protein